MPLTSHVTTNIWSKLTQAHYWYSHLWFRKVSENTNWRPPGWKGPRACMNIQQRMRIYRSRVTVRYHLVPPQTIHFQTLENHGVLCARSNLWHVGPGSGSLQLSALSLHHISLFFITLIVTCPPGHKLHATAKPQNNDKYCTITIDSTVLTGYEISVVCCTDDLTQKEYPKAAF